MVALPIIDSLRGVFQEDRLQLWPGDPIAFVRDE